MTKRILTALICLVLLPSLAGAQSKAETNLYGRTIKRPTVKAADKFLKKYPESVYAPKVQRLRDSLVFFAIDYDDAEGMRNYYNTYPDSPFIDLATDRIMEHNATQIDHEEALQIAGKCIDAIGFKVDNVEHVVALDEGLSLRFLSPSGELKMTRSIPVYSLSDNPGAFTLVKFFDLLPSFDLRNYLYIGYLNGDSEYVEVLYLPYEDIVYQAMFYGNPMKPAEGEDFRIEGQSPEMIEGLDLSPGTAWILEEFKANSSLQQISKADLLADAAIEWWLEKNPKAQSGATRLHFGQLDPESSIVAACKKAPKEKGKSSNVAVFDIRGYTVICAVSKSTGDCTLVWCEPACRNKKAHRYLSSVYFDSDGTTLNLFYYVGRSISKLKISLPSQTLRRSS
ncbi:MAG: hypothetical protein K6E37_04430 [Bacteroidales bacterium]|nr:hypothetical protein [Bacteroidales bacterium]